MCYCALMLNFPSDTHRLRDNYVFHLLANKLVSCLSRVQVHKRNMLTFKFTLAGVKRAVMFDDRL